MSKNESELLEEFTDLLNEHGQYSDEVCRFRIEHENMEKLFQTVMSVRVELQSGRLALKPNDLENAKKAYLSEQGDDDADSCRELKQKHLEQSRDNWKAHAEMLSKENEVLRAQCERLLNELDNR